MNPVGRLLLALVRQGGTSSKPQRDKVLRFLASHMRIHNLLAAAAKSRLGRAMVRRACREALTRYKGADLREIFRLLKDFRNFSESTEINALSEIYERSLNPRWVGWISDLARGLEQETKEKLLMRVVYNIGLNGLNRKIDRLRYEGVENRVPNLSTVFLGTTSRCNLDCRDCESRFERDDGAASCDSLDYIIDQAKRLRVFHVVLIGKGEPLFDEAHKKTIFRLVAKHWDLNFLLFTNGTTLTEEDVVGMGYLDNLFTLISVDGLKRTNDERRGNGVFARICNTMKMMKDRGLFFGFSSTVFKENYREILSQEFLYRMKDLGCKTGIYLMYLPLSGQSARHMLLSESEVREYEDLYKKAQEFAPIPIVDPEIFERVHGCRARRGAIVYIDASTGKVMPCVKTPFVPAWCNILTHRHRDRLREILGMDFYVEYRDSYTLCSQCSLNLEKEIDMYVSQPGLTPEDREKAENYLAKISASRT